jgi:hypothetical protein
MIEESKNEADLSNDHENIELSPEFIPQNNLS